MFEKAELPIPCVNCGNKTKKTVAWLKSHKTFTCGCGATVDASPFVGSIKQANKAVDDFKRSLKRFKR